MRHFRVQLIGGIVIHQGRIAEMRTGEGKTLVATLPVYLNALSGKGVHVVTVNDYLAKRDSVWMGKLYNFLGLTVGLVVPNMTPDEKRVDGVDPKRFKDSIKLDHHPFIEEYEKCEKAYEYIKGYLKQDTQKQLAGIDEFQKRVIAILS